MSTRDAGDGDAAGDLPGYGEAVVELESILVELEVDEADVDLLAVRVRRAAELIRACRRRIDAARFEVEQVVAHLDDPSDPSDPTDLDVLDEDGSGG